MTILACFSCGAETSNGLALCSLCQRKATTDLAFLPVYFKNLARWRPGRAGSRPVPDSRVLWSGDERTDGTGDRISDTLDETANMLATWAKALVDDRPHFPRPLTFADAVLTGDLSPETAEALGDDQGRAVALLCLAFDRHLTSVSTLGWCGEFVRDLGQHEERLRGLTEEVVPGWYAGACRYCQSGTYVVPGLTWVTCRVCGSTTYARDHLETILDEARGWVARPMRLAEVVVALVDTELSVVRLYERIKKWEQREKITGIRRLDADGDEVGPKRYRLGDVMDLIGREGETRVVRVQGMVSA